MSNINFLPCIVSNSLNLGKHTVDLLIKEVIVKKQRKANKRLGTFTNLKFILLSNKS